jgi:hypothetical protein
MIAKRGALQTSLTRNVEVRLPGLDEKRISDEIKDVPREPKLLLARIPKQNQDPELEIVNVLHP